MKKSSTIWIAKEMNDKPLSDLLKYLLQFYNKNMPITIKGEEEYEFSLRSLENYDNLHVGLLYKYKKDTSIRTYIPITRNDTKEKTNGHLILGEAYFCIADEFLMVEEKPPHFGHVMATRILDAIAQRVNNENRFKFDFLNSGNAIDDIFEQIKDEKIKKIKFKNIRRNAKPTNKSLIKFEDFTTDTGVKDMELSSPKDGLNHDSSYIEGGKILAKENKANIAIETETDDKSPKTYDTSDARNKVKSKVTYENEDERPGKLREAFKKLRNFHRNK